MNCLTTKLFVILIPLLSQGCKDKVKFNKQDWEETYDGSYPKRICCVENILEIKYGKNLNIDSAKSKFYGEEDYSDSTQNEVTYVYKIEEKYGFDIDPQYHSELQIKTDKKPS